jgi:hypothetical protein
MGIAGWPEPCQESGQLGATADRRNSRLNRMAINVAARIRGIDSKSAKWIASDALRELTSAALCRRDSEKGKPDKSLKRF